jgi:hypothetical protein
LLGISKETLRYRMEKYRLRSDDLDFQSDQSTSARPA